MYGERLVWRRRTVKDGVYDRMVALENALDELRQDQSDADRAQWTRFEAEVKRIDDTAKRLDRRIDAMEDRLSRLDRRIDHIMNLLSNLERRR
jgi:archaellum component FlaC